jgi:hypothetical protein
MAVDWLGSLPRSLPAATADDLQPTCESGCCKSVVPRFLAAVGAAPWPRDGRIARAEHMARSKPAAAISNETRGYRVIPQSQRKKGRLTRRTFWATQSIERNKQTIQNHLYTCLFGAEPSGKTSVWSVGGGFVSRDGARPCEAIAQSVRNARLLLVGEKFRRPFRREHSGGTDRRAAEVRQTPAGARKKPPPVPSLDAFENPQLSRGCLMTGFWIPLQGGPASAGHLKLKAPSGYSIGSSKGSSDYEHRRGCEPFPALEILYRAAGTVASGFRRQTQAGALGRRWDGARPERFADSRQPAPPGRPLLN